MRRKFTKFTKFGIIEVSVSVAQVCWALLWVSVLPVSQPLIGLRPLHPGLWLVTRRTQTIARSRLRWGDLAWLRGAVAMRPWPSGDHWPVSTESHISSLRVTNMDVQAPGQGSGSKLRCLHPSLSFSSSASDNKHKQLQNSRSFDPGSGAIGECHEARDPGSGGSPGASLAVPATKVSRSTSPFSFYRSRS